MKPLPPVLLTLLVACNAPSPFFRDAPATRVDIGPVAFDVRVRGGLAEAVRTTPGWAPNIHGIAAFAEAAMERVSGCDVLRISGDQALLLGELDCGPDGPRAPESTLILGYECDPVESWSSEDVDQTTISFDCIPVYR